MANAILYVSCCCCCCCWRDISQKPKQQKEREESLSPVDIECLLKRQHRSITFNLSFCIYFSYLYVKNCTGEEEETILYLRYEIYPLGFSRDNRVFNNSESQFFLKGRKKSFATKINGFFCCIILTRLSSSECFFTYDKKSS